MAFVANLLSGRNELLSGEGTVSCRQFGHGNVAPKGLRVFMVAPTRKTSYKRGSGAEEGMEESGFAQRALSFGSRHLRIFGGTACPKLASDVARYLGFDGPHGMIVKRFADDEVYVKITESVRGCDVFLIQSTCSPVNDSLMELLLMIDACRRAHAAQITAVVPYYGYARADRLIEKREALGSKLCANLITRAGADRVIVMDIHSPQSCGFFDIPLDHIHGSAVLAGYLTEHQMPMDDLVIVSPDVGGVKRARYFAKELNDSSLAIIDKRRPASNVSEVMNLIGDVQGKTAIVVDDMIDTAGTICQSSDVLLENGAKRVFAMATHPLFSGPARDRLANSGFEQVIVTDTIPIPADRTFPQLRVVSIAQTVGETIWRNHADFAVSY
eukprot:CAMPEP_0184744074 /NCGR_PEP_ID=MMETSP0315-20130426/6855_1 /TAXON_ID=101924 /ORGANISM="Rhodosorus marinus, Strain UTEX LB 2760" /LENGTH=384 /DNA_ID=CAMNT_0027215613 /DNA_START=345 /DNA_END=1499 /DNA_ORIENTATION=-